MYAAQEQSVCAATPPLLLVLLDLRWMAAMSQQLPELQGQRDCTWAQTCSSCRSSAGGEVRAFSVCISPHCPIGGMMLAGSRAGVDRLVGQAQRCN